MTQSAYPFQPESYTDELSAIVAECSASEDLSDAALQQILRRHPKDGTGFFSKSELIRGYRHLRSAGIVTSKPGLVARLRMKPVRTRSGVAPVTVLTQPFPCPGQCIFCPSDVRMPKSYVSSEPGAQRAAEHRFDPYLQTRSRLTSLHSIGHPVDKVELIVLGGTWSFYPEAYRRWFVMRCLEALNDFEPGGDRAPPSCPSEPPAFAFEATPQAVDGRTMERRYNDVIVDLLGHDATARPQTLATWEDLGRAQARNESAPSRCVGLSLETRPDHLDGDELLSLRRFGATKVQIGYQSLDDEVLRRNRRGHDVAATRRAMRLLRQAGFKIHAHWMPNLYGSSPARDLEDYRRIFADPDFRPDELKIYPCSLLESAELMSYHQRGEWAPYSVEALEALLAECMAATPPWCRLSRVIRDIPSQEIVVGNRFTNLRQRAERRARENGSVLRDIRSREVGGRAVSRRELHLAELEYSSSIGGEVFLQFVDADDRLAGFLRLLLPCEASCIEELGRSAVIREVHVYGSLVELGGRSAGAAQHRGLGTELVERAVALARGRGYPSVAVISAIGTRAYYRRLGFSDGDLYQHRRTLPERSARGSAGC